MRIKLLCCLMVFLLALPVIAKPPKGDYTAPSVAIIDNETFISANRILMFVTNHGNFGRDLAGVFGHDYGTWYPYPVGQDTALINATELQRFTPNYASGLWVGATDQATGETRIIISEYDSEYVPGPMNGSTFFPDAPEFRVYKLYADSLRDNPNQDYTDYMTYGPSLGAPFWEEDTYRVDTTVDPWDSTLIGEEGEPRIIGDQFLWAVYNDADPDQHGNDAGETNPCYLEVKQSIFGFNRDDPLGDVVFMRYRIFNRGDRVLENCYFSLWCDPDVGGSGDDLVGCDTLLGLGYAYNGDNDDQYYDDHAPSWAFDFFQGPMVPGDPEDTAIMWDFQKFPGMKNLGMTSFNKYINGTDPDNFNQTYWFMQGLTKTGGPYIYNGQTLKFVCSGDPVAGTGDIDIAPDDRRWMQTTGPITFGPGDSTEIVAASICAMASSNKTSISLMKFYDRFAQLAFDSQFVVLEPPARPVISAGKEAGTITLSWTDTSEVDAGSYPFEGYAVYQGETPAGPWYWVTNFDIQNAYEDILDLVFNPITGVGETRLVQNGTNTGLQRHITITTDVITDLPIRDATEYYYKVEAYTLFPGDLSNPEFAGLLTLTSAATISVTPQAPPIDVVYGASIDDILPVTHTAGVSGGVITPIVVDPYLLTGDTYRIVFADTPGIVIDTSIPDPINAPEDTVFDSTNIAWHLINVTTTDTLLLWQTNQTNDEDYLVVEGFKVKVSGPPAGFNSFEVVANAGGVVDPPEPGALFFGDFPVPTFNDPDGYITELQQVASPGGQWGFHTADNGGTCGGGERPDYAAFVERAIRNDNAVRIGINDFEMRFTGSYDDPGVNGSYTLEWFNDDNVFWVPFELWHLGAGTVDDPSDDFRLPFAIIDDGEDDSYNLESWGCVNDAVFGGDGEHSVSSLDNDPFTDWVYWWLPLDVSPGESGYNACETDLLAGTFDGSLIDAELLARTVLVSWNGGAAPPFNQDLPELGTVFRFTTAKPNNASDVFEFTTPVRTSLADASQLDLIKAVPNPFYLIGNYDPNPGSYAIKWHHLPKECTISIYNLAGELVRTIDKDDEDAIATWDVLTENGLPVASGIYIYVVDAPGIGTKIGKMAVFVEQEVLDIY